MVQILVQIPQSEKHCARPSRLLIFFFNFSYNKRKFFELPHQASVVLSTLYDQSDFVIDLLWIEKKISCIGCTDFFYDTYLATSINLPHLKFLREFINKYYTALCYDGSQFSNLFINEFKKSQIQLENLSIENNILSKWKAFVSNVPNNWLEIVNDVQPLADDLVYIDTLINSNEDGYTISLSQNKAEVCVWDVQR